MHNTYIRASGILCGHRAANFKQIHEIKQNSQKQAKYRKNSLKIVPNTCQFNTFETSLGCWCCLLAVHLQIYCETSSLHQVNNIQKLPGILRLMLLHVKSFAICTFLKRTVVKRANDVCLTWGHGLRHS